MHGPRTILDDLALVLCVAAITTVLFRRLRQPVVLGYLLAGLIVGPHIPIPLFVDPERIATLSELGVILVMFSVGLEFSVRRLIRVVPTSGIVGAIQIGTMLSIGYLAGQAFGWRPMECLFTGAIVSISSTMIVARVFAEQRVSASLTETVFGVLVVQDLAAVLLLALLTALSTGHGQASTVLARTAVQLSGFLFILLLVGFLVVPRAIRAVAKLESPETLLVSSIGVCFAFALLAHGVGYSVALGAFIAGSLVAESGEAERVEHLIRPVRDVFAAVFFVSVGMVLDPSLVAMHWKAALVLTAIVVAGQVTSVTLGAFLSGRDVKTSIQAGMSLAQIGEFSFVIASLGASTGATRRFLYPVAVAVSVLTAFATPWLVRASAPVAAFVDRRLPKPIQTFVTVYGAWLERMRAASPEEGRRMTRTRLVRFLALDGIILAGLVIGSSLGMQAMLAGLRVRVGLDAQLGRLVVLGVVALLCLPLVIAVVRVARAIGVGFADEALDESLDGAPLAATPSAPRRAVIVTIQLVVVLLVGIPLVALTQPFLPPLYGFAIFAALVSILGVSFWRSATHLDAHVQAGTERLLEVLGSQSRTDSTLDVRARDAGISVSILDGFGPLTALALEPTSHAIGRTLAELDLRALSGASVVTILRGSEALRPTGREPLREGDVLAVAGSRQAIAEASALLGTRQGGSDTPRARVLPLES